MPGIVPGIVGAHHTPFIRYDTFSHSLGNTNTFSWTHTPVGTAAGVLVFIVAVNESTDKITTVTYGGSSMTEATGSPFNATLGASLDHEVYCYTIGSAVPTGAQTVAVTCSSAMASGVHAVAMSVVGSGAVVVEDTTTKDQTTNSANPTVDLTIANESLCFGVVIATVAATTDIAPSAGMTEIDEFDPGSQIVNVARKTALVSANTTLDWTAAGATYGCFAIALRCST